MEDTANEKSNAVNLKSFCHLREVKHACLKNKNASCFLVKNSNSSLEPNKSSTETTACGEKALEFSESVDAAEAANEKEKICDVLFSSSNEWSLLHSSGVPDALPEGSLKRFPNKFYKKEREILRQYVEERGGCHTVIRILIANNGNAAVKAIRSFREWTLHEFDTDRFFEIVVMATQDDIEANAEYVSEGDFLAEVPGGPSENNYSNIPLIVQIAEEYECDAIWAGWGHASENPKLPLALETSILAPLWIGPSAKCMQLVGDKIGATLLAQSLGIPCVPWSGSDVTCDVAQVIKSGCISQSHLARCCVTCVEEALKICRMLGYPAVIKASSGGGGRGIRKVFSDEDVESAYCHVLSEVKDSYIFVMKLLTHCRHLEVQNVADRFSQVASIGTRDCTVQRRCQKIIEECPVTVAPNDIIQQMEKYSIRLLSTVGYLSVATCEFLYDLNTGKVYFLEVNPRLQVEHVVTEVVHQINLPAIQLQSVLGIPLAHLLGLQNSETVKQLCTGRHCMAARITAENAEENFRPTCGEVVELQLRSSMNAWGYFFLGVTGQVHRFADSQIGHVFALGKDREEARRHLILALKRLTLRGEIHTNVEALLKILSLSDFIRNSIHTTWVEEFFSSTVARSLTSEDFNRTTQEQDPLEMITPTDILAVSLAASCEAFLTFKRNEADFVAKIHQGQLPPPISCSHAVEYVYKNVRFTLKCFHTGPCNISVSLNHSCTEMVLRPVTLIVPLPASSTRGCQGAEDELTSSACFLISGGPDHRSRRVFYKINSSETSITVDGSTYTFVKENDPTQVRAPVSGRLSKWLIPSGTPVTRGTTYADIEIMKMYMQLQVANDGILSHALAEGAVFKAGDPLATLELYQGVSLKKCVDFVASNAFKLFEQNTISSYSKVLLHEEFPEVYKIRLEQPKLRRRFLRAKESLRCVLNGYQYTTSTLKEVLNVCLDGFFNPIFSLYEILDTFSSIGLPPPAEICAVLKTINPPLWNEQNDAFSTCSSSSVERNSVEDEKGPQPIVPYFLRCWQLRKMKMLFNILENYLIDKTTHHSDAFSDNTVGSTLEPLVRLVQRSKHGLLITAAETLKELLSQYLDVEEVFHQCSNESASKVLLLKRRELDAERLAVLARSHEALRQKNDLVIQLLGVLRQYYPYFMDLSHLFNDVLQRLSRLTKPQYAAVSLRARQLLLMRHHQPFIERTLALIKSFAELLERQNSFSFVSNPSQRLGNFVSLSPAFQNAHSTGAPCCTYHSSMPHGPLSCCHLTQSHHGVTHVCFNHPVCYGSVHCISHQPHRCSEACHGMHHNNTTQMISSATTLQTSPALKVTCTSVGSAFPQGGQSEQVKQVVSPGITPLQYSNLGECISLIQTFVKDWKNVGDDSLIALLAHPKADFSKLALEIYVRRHFEPCGLHDFKMGFTGEFWWRRAAVFPEVQKEKSSKPFMKSDTLEESLKDPLDLSVGKMFDTISSYGTYSLVQTNWSNERPSLTQPLPLNESDSILPICSLKTENKSYEANKCNEYKKERGELESNDHTILNTAGLQRVNRLLAVWISSALISYDFLTQCCDVLIEHKFTCGSSNSLGREKNIGHEGSIAQATDYTRAHSVPTCGSEDVQNPVSLFSTHDVSPPTNTFHTTTNSMAYFSKAEEKCKIKTSFSDAQGDITTCSGLNRNSRLGHMLNAFADSGSTESNTGQLQMFVAMAFQNFELFRIHFGDCLKEYSELQAFMPPPPPAIDGKVLLIFISEMGDYNKSCNVSLSLSPNNSSLFEMEFQSLGSQIAVLGFHIIQVCFTCERHIMTTLFEDFSQKQSNSEDSSRTDHVVPYEMHCVESDESSFPKDTWYPSCIFDASRAQHAFNIEEPFEDFDSVFSCVPRYFYFRNVAALPPLSVSNEVKNETFTLEGLVTDNANFVEEVILRNVCCSQFHLMELKRLVNFFIQVEPVSVPHIHLFLASPKRLSGSLSCCAVGKAPKEPMFRFFVRILLHYQLKQPEDDDWDDLERHFVTGLNALELTLKNKFPRGQRPSLSHHILMYVKVQGPLLPFLATTVLQSQTLHHISPSLAENVVFSLAQRYESRLIENGVGTLEVRFVQDALYSSENIVPIRIVITNPTRQSLQVNKYVEITDPTSGELIFSALDASDSLAMSARHPCLSSKPERSEDQMLNTKPQAFLQSFWNSISVNRTSSNTWNSESVYDGLPVCSPHPLFNPLEEKRALAASLSTIYIYDFLELFAEAVKKQWRSCPKYFIPGFSSSALSRSHNHTLDGQQQALGGKDGFHRSLSMALIPDKVLESVELVLDDNGEIYETVREPGQNDCGMVAWRVLLRTPEFPRGRRMILVGNDVTFQMGTFGLREDLLFQRVSKIARNEGIPRIYIAVNSGARMGLATEVQAAFQVEWVEPSNPLKGFKYLYLNEVDYHRFNASDSIVAEPIIHPATQQCIYRLTSVIGSEVGLGVENLCGSGAIAGETSRAYDSNVTITFVTGRTVGIGAYLSRLGHRVIQKATSAPILLTGYQVINRLIRRDVYTSNDELGGVDIMANNGITHIVVANDTQGCEEIIRWLSYVPEHTEGAIPIMVDPTDPITRPVLYRVSSLTEDPRLMLTGCLDGKGQWLGGVFDRGTFREVLTDWAKSVIVARARLGGIPVGVIAVETRVTETVIPADPAVVDSVETKLLRPGQMWFPDSAYKTAEAICNFNHEEIPLIIFANWRGFSGGQRDMFHEVLKFGSFIVDALVRFKQPCIVYIPPKAELRGGAWVVVDSRINPYHMDMFADPDCRGGVLEPTGTVEIKFRNTGLATLAERLDPVLKQIILKDQQLAMENVALDDPRRSTLKETRDKRLQEILSIYKQVAVHFADLHDTAQRMKKKDAIHDIVPWERSRTYFYWRLRRQLILFNLRLEVRKANPNLSIPAAEKLIFQWAKESGETLQDTDSNTEGSSCELNVKFVHWACRALSDISRRLAALRSEYQQSQLVALMQKSPRLVKDTLQNVAQNSLIRN